MSTRSFNSDYKQSARRTKATKWPRVQLKIDKAPYYAGYHSSAVDIVPAGTIGCLIQTDVPFVDRPGSFCIVDFSMGAHGIQRCGLQKSEFKVLAGKA